MDRDELTAMLQKDLADEHASIIRYLVHAYQVGENTPFGQMLLATAREEMWHMDWVGDQLAELDIEPDMVQGEYPYDPTSNASALRSYIDWERNLILVYDQQAEMVEDRELKRVLQQLGWESITHLKRFEAWLERLGSDGEKPLTFEESHFSPHVLQRFEREVDENYRLVLQHLRQAFVFRKKVCPVGSELELTAMRHMKHMSHFAETLAEVGKELPFDFPGIDQSLAVREALASDLDLTKAARERFIVLAQDPEIEADRGLKVEIENMITRNGLLETIVEELMEEVKAQEQEPQEGTAGAKSAGPGFTVGSLKK